MSSRRFNPPCQKPEKQMAYAESSLHSSQDYSSCSHLLHNMVCYSKYATPYSKEVVDARRCPMPQNHGWLSMILSSIYQRLHCRLHISQHLNYSSGRLMKAVLLTVSRDCWCRSEKSSGLVWLHSTANHTEWIVGSHCFCLSNCHQYSLRCFIQNAIWTRSQVVCHLTYLLLCHRHGMTVVYLRGLGFLFFFQTICFS